MIRDKLEDFLFRVAAHSFQWSFSLNAYDKNVFGFRVASGLCSPLVHVRSVTSHHSSVTHVMPQKASANQNEAQHGRFTMP